MGMSISRDSSHVVRVNDSSVTNQLNELLNYLILSGQLNIHDFEEYLEESDDSDFDYPVATVRPPKIHFPLNTTTLDQSDIKVITGQSCGIRKKRTLARPKNIVNVLGMQQTGMPGSGNFTRGDMCRITNYRVPCNFSKEIDKYSGKTFVGIFSDDGSRLLTVSQDRNLHLYDSSTPRYTHLKQEKGKDIDWSILDAAFSPDGRTVIFSSWSTCLHSWRINDDSDPAGSAQDKLVIREAESRYACFSVCFSYDGSYILTGVGDGCVYVYDRHTDKCTLQLPAHQKDVNAVRFGSYGDNVILSGSDDGLIKVWDRRIVNTESPKEVGMFSGHRDGITYLDMKGDGRHFISNSKDQTVKLWDMRKFSNMENRSIKSYSTPEWDYRWQPVPKQLQSKTQLPEDTSIMTYRGHAVLRTLIRSKFSPARTTGQRYIYTGCATGRVVVYDLLTGQIEKIINAHDINVRDVSWHPYRPEIVTTSWDSSVKLWDNTVSMIEEFEDDIPPKRVRRSARIAARKRSEAERIKREARLRRFTDGAGPSIS